MSDCLVTTLKGVVNDDSLPYMGDFEIFVSSGDGYPRVTLQSSDLTKVIAHGGNICETDGSAIGTECSFTGSKTIAFDANVTAFTVRSGYSLKTISANSQPEIIRMIRIPLDALQYQKNLTTFGLCPSRNGASYTGSLQEFFKKHPALNAVMLNDVATAETAQLSWLALCPRLEVFSANASTIAGKIEDLAGNPALASLQLGYAKPKISGDLAKLPASMAYFVSHAGNKFTWSSRSTSLWPISFVYVNLGSYIDTMLINAAQCTAENTYPGLTAKRMILYGTRTSASDAAVATLQAKGWTITVTEA